MRVRSVSQNASDTRASTWAEPSRKGSNLCRSGEKAGKQRSPRLRQQLKSPQQLCKNIITTEYALSQQSMD
jgi:hypothetical protein